MLNLSKKFVSILVIAILIASSLAFIDSNNNSPIAISEIPESNSTIPVNNSSCMLISYVPDNLQQYVNDTFQSYGIHYSFSGNLLNVNYTQNPQFLKSFFNNLQNTFNIDYFIFNSTDDILPVQSSGSNAEPYYPSNIYSAYDINEIHSEGYYGNGTTIVIVDAYGDPDIQYDVSAFDNITGLPPINLSIITPEGSITSTNSGWATETAIDVEWSHAIAPGAKIDLVLAPSDNYRLLDSVEYAVNKSLGNIISLSWGEPESTMSIGEINSLNNIYEEAAIKNITVVAASGDEGADDGTSSKTVNFPASDPYVLGVGGTSLYETPGGAYYQTAWGDMVSGKVEASGGGYSSYFATPYYQIAPDYSSTLRGVPDVALDANPNTGILAVVDGSTYTLGGTSIATPMWAGIVAILDQYTNASLGFLNPVFYKISETKYYSDAFTQVTSGSNYGYSAGAGWNPVTGLGTPNVTILAMDIKTIMRSYGSVLLLNNTEYANKISAEINVSSSSVEQFNGSTFYYTGFYTNQSNFIKFGIDVNSTGYYYMYEIMDNGVETSWISSGSGSGYFTVQIDGTYVQFLINNNTEGNNLYIPVAFSGDYHAALGAQQNNPEINFVNIPEAVFSDINAYYNNTPVSYTGAYESGYSPLGSSYSNITFKLINSGKAFIALKGTEDNSQISGKSGSDKILYKISYGEKSTLTFSLSNGSSNSYYINGKSISGDATKLSSGYNTVNTTYNGQNLSRTIFVPDIVIVYINITSSPSYFSPEYNITVDHYFNYTSSVKTLKIYELVSDNNVTISALGYKTAYYNTNVITSVEITPLNVKFTIFSYNGNASVTFNGLTSINDGGYHYISIQPGNVTVNVTQNGYKNYSETFKLYPGENNYIPVLLIPENSSLKEIIGKVQNGYDYYNLSNVKIVNGSTVEGYTDNSGTFKLFFNPAANMTFSEYLYTNNTTAIKNGSIVYMYPENVSVVSIDFKITYDLPLAFYYLYVSWTPYKYSGFAEYVIYYSTSSLMTNAKDVVVSGQGTDFTILPGMTPGKTYYIIVDEYNSNGSFISSNEEVAHYTVASYLINALIYVIIIAYIAFMIIFFIGRRKRRKKIDDDFFNEFP